MLLVAAVFVVASAVAITVVVSWEGDEANTPDFPQAGKHADERGRFGDNGAASQGPDHAGLDNRNAANRARRDAALR
jgi:hypothetical protein